MKFRLHRRSRAVHAKTLPARSFGSLHSEGSTFQATDDECGSLGVSSTHVVPRKVCFDESDSTYYESAYSLDTKNTTWYSNQDIRIFKAETKRIAEIISQALLLSSDDKNNKTESWPDYLLEAYISFCDHGNKNHLVKFPCTRATGSIVGLDRWVLNVMARDKNDRRRQLWARIKEIQSRHSCSGTPSERIAEESIKTTEPSRLYATHVALWWAGQGGDPTRLLVER